MGLFSSIDTRAVIMINDTTVRCVIAKKEKGNHLHVSHVIEQRIPSGMIVGGVVEQPALFVELLRSFKKKLPRRRVHILLPEEVVIVAPLPRPHDAMKDKKIEAIVREELTNALATISAPAEGFEVLSIIDDGSRLYVDLASSSLVDTYRTLFHTAGFAVASVDTPHPDWVAAPGYGEASHIMVGFGNTTTSIILLNGGVPVMKSMVPVGRRQMVDAVRTMLAIQTHEAEKIIARYGVSPEHREDRVLHALYELLRPLEIEINSMIGAWKAKPYKTARERFSLLSILVHGDAYTIPGLHDRMAHTTRMPSRYLDAASVLGSNDAVHDMTRDEVVRFAPLLWKIRELLQA